MLEYFAYKKFQQSKQQKAAAASDDAEQDASTQECPKSTPDTGDSPSPDPSTKGKAAEVASPAIDEQDERFLETNLDQIEPMTLKRRIYSLGEHLPSLRRSGKTPKTAPDTSDVEKPSDDESDKLPAESDDAQRNQLQKFFEAFDMSLSASKDGKRTMAQRMNDKFGVSTMSAHTKQLMTEFVQILRDIQSGAPLAGQDLLNFFDKHTQDLKQANDSVPHFIKALVLKLLPVSTLPTLADLSKPGALLGLIKSVLQVLKQRFPAFIGSTVLMVLAVLIVMLGLFYAYKRGRDEREGGQAAGAESVDTNSSGPSLPNGRQVEISVDGVRTVYVYDEDGMKIPVPVDDERGVYWDAKRP